MYTHTYTHIPDRLDMFVFDVFAVALVTFVMEVTAVLAKLVRERSLRVS
jgi:hypothetical protein